MDEEEIPDVLFEQAKPAEAEPRVPLRAWLRTFGELRHLRSETGRIGGIMEEEFNRIEYKEWR